MGFLQNQSYLACARFRPQFGCDPGCDGRGRGGSLVSDCYLAELKSLRKSASCVWRISRGTCRQLQMPIPHLLAASLCKPCSVPPSISIINGTSYLLMSSKRMLESSATQTACCNLLKRCPKPRDFNVATSNTAITCTRFCTGRMSNLPIICC